MTTLIYNGVYLRDCETLAFEQTVQYDESGTDTLFSRFKIKVASTVVAVSYPQSDRQFGIQPKHGSTAVQKMHDIQARLSQPRKDFWFLIESCVSDETRSDQPVLDQPLLIATGEAFTERIVESTVPGGIIETVVQDPRMLRPHPDRLATDNLTTNEYGPFNMEFEASKVLDLENGPKPKSVNIRKIIGGRSLRVEFEIEICRKFCESDFVDEKPTVAGGLTNPNPHVLSNRWSLDESKDDAWVTTRTMQGTLRVTDSSWWPHAMRYLCIPGLLKGYQRTRQSFVSDPEGLTLKYRIEDKQAHAAPPYPAIKWSARHSEGGSGTMGVRKTGDFFIRLTGPPGVDKVALIGAAGKVVVNRVKSLLPRRNDQGKLTYDTIIRNAVVTDVLHEPSIEMRVQVSYNKVDYTALGLRLLEMGKPLQGLDTEGQDSGDDPYIIDGYKPDVWPVPLAYDSKTPAGVFACYLQHPCSAWHSMPIGFQPAEAAPNPRYPSYENPTPPNKESGKTDSASDSEQATELFAATGSLDPVPLPADESQTTSDTDFFDFPYSYIELTQRYVGNNGWVALPLAQTEVTGRSAALVKLHAPVARRVLTMTASRDGKMPILPSMKEEQVDHNDIREVLDDWEVALKNPELGVDGTGRRFAVEATFHYLLEGSPGPEGKLRGASSPLDLFSPDMHWLDLAESSDTSGHLQWDADTTETFPPTEEA